VKKILSKMLRNPSLLSKTTLLTPKTFLTAKKNKKIQKNYVEVSTSSHQLMNLGATVVD